MCFIIDGLDEYHPQDRDNSVIFQLLDKTFLPLAMIVVTSRPIAIAYLKEEFITDKIKVIGFSKEQILKYIHSFPFDTTYHTKLKEYLHSHPNVFNMCYLPVHAAMICYLFKFQKGNIPNTQTKIYEKFICFTILRLLKRHNPKAQVHSLKDLKGSTSSHFNKLCQLAYIMTINKKQLATPEEMGDELCEYNSDERGLGLISVNIMAELSGFTETYSFLHLTVQEFLTAYYITSFDLDKQMKEVSNFLSMSSPVAIFYFGLVHFHGKETLEKLHFKSYVSSFMCHCAFESQQQIVYDVLGRQLSEYTILFPTPSDLYAISHFMLHSSHSINRISINGSDDDDCDYADFLHSISRKDFSSSLLRLAINSKLNNLATFALSDMLKSCTDLISATLSFHEICPDGAEAIMSRLKHLENLQSLTLRIYSTAGGITTLLSGLTRSTGSKLNTVNLYFYDMDTKGMLEISSGLHFLVDSSIFTLKLSGCSIDGDAATALAAGLPSVANLYYLHISNSIISHNGVITLLHGAHSLTQLTRLHISHCNIGSDGASALANQLQCFKQLHYLLLPQNNIGPDGAISLANQLHHLTELQWFDLSHNNIDLKSAVAIISASKDCPCLVCIELNINPGSYSSYGIHVEGLVSLDDTTAITELKAAAQHSPKQRKLHFGF